MPPGRQPSRITLSDRECQALRQLVDGPAKQVAKRAEIVLACADGATNGEVAGRLGISLPTVIKWRHRFRKGGLESLQGKARPGRPQSDKLHAPVELSDDERNELARLSRRRKSAQPMALRARIVLSCAEGKSNAEIAAGENVHPVTVAKWRRRFLDCRIAALSDEPRTGTPRTITDDQVEEVVVKTLESIPENATHWSTRSLAKRVGLSQTAVSRIWRAFGLQAHRVETFKLSKDPYLVEKIRDIVGLYLNPPERAIVLCIDEKSQIQALERSQPILPFSPGEVERVTHDYFRHGTTTLFAALNVATGQVIGRCYPQHRAVEFKRFLDMVVRQMPKNQAIHLVIDNYGTHKTSLIHNWLLKHPDVTLHFTPTSASWMNLVERFFSRISTDRIRRDSFRGTKELEDAIYDYLATYNENPRPFVWTKTADQILESVKRVCERISNSGH